MPSGVIKSFDYQPVLGLLTIHFVSGAVYQYYEVSSQVVEEFKKFREKGVFYNNHIKGKYKFARIEG
jgi:hypothetical protein